MEYRIFIKERIPASLLSSLKELVEFCKKHDNIALSLPTPYPEDVNEDVPDIHYFVTLKDEQCIGVMAVCLFPVGFNRDGEIAFSYEVSAFVHPDYRRQGIFTNLLNIFLENENLHLHDRHILFLTDRHCSAGLLAATKFQMQHIRSEYLMEADLNAKPHLSFDLSFSSPVSTLVHIVPCKCKRILARHYSTLFLTSKGRGRDYVKETLKDETISPFLIRYKWHFVGSGYLMQAGPDHVYLFSFGILPKYRRKGLGLEAILTLKRQLAPTTKVLSVQVAGYNIPACKLYDKAGFSLTQQVLYVGWA